MKVVMTIHKEDLAVSLLVSISMLIFMIYQQVTSILTCKMQTKLTQPRHHIIIIITIGFSCFSIELTIVFVAVVLFLCHFIITLSRPLVNTTPNYFCFKNGCTTLKFFLHIVLQ